MFTKLKKKIAEEAAIAPRPGSAARIPRSVSKESITSVGADSGDDFASDGSNSRDDLPSQISRRNDHIRRLEAKLSATVRKFQEQNEVYQAHQAKMVEEHLLALEKKDQEKKQLSIQIDIMNKKSLSFFQKRDDLDELQVFQLQEMSKVKHMLLNKEELLSQAEQELELLRAEVVVLRAEYQDAKELSAKLKEDLQKMQGKNDKLSQQRTELITAQEGAERIIAKLKKRQQELQDFIQNLSLDLQKAQSVGCSSEKRLTEVQEEFEALRLHHEQFKSKITTVNEKLQRAQDHLQQKEADFSCFKDESYLKLNNLEQTLQTVRKRLQNQEEELKQQSLLEKEVVSLNEKNKDLEVTLTKHKNNQEKMKEELSSRETVNMEITKALEETQKQKEDLQQQVVDLHTQVEESTQEISLKNEELIRKDKKTANLKQDYDALVLKIQQLHSDLEIYKTKATHTEESSATHSSSLRDQLQKPKSQVSFQQEPVSTLHKPLNGSESKGEVGVGDIQQLQRENKELEQQILEKNKTIKQLQQRMVELKKTLQKELKLKPEPEVNDVQEKPNSDPLPSSLTVTCSSDLTDSREINIEYLKHVVLKFMSAREAEAFHLIKAVSVLLNFSVEEENLLKETLEYKMSWFGSKPVPKGTVRPSITKPRTTWS